MKSKLLKISMLTAVLIFVFTGASWADSRKNRHHYNVQNKHYKAAKYRNPAHYNHGWNKHHRRHYRKNHNRHQQVHRARRHAYKHRHNYHGPVPRPHRYHHKPVYKHHHYRHYEHDHSYNEFSIGVLIFEPGFGFSIATKRRW